MPPKLSLSGQPHPAHEAWTNPPQGRYYGDRPPIGSRPSQGSDLKKHPDTAGPMAQQQQQLEREPHQQRLPQQQSSISTA